MNCQRPNFFVFIFMLFGSVMSFGQSIQLTLVKKPPHLAKIDNVEDFQAQLFVSAVNISSQEVTFNLNFTATGPNGLVVKADLFLEENIVLGAGESLVIDGTGFEEYGTKNLSEDNIQPASERDYLKINRVLREGRYTFCIVAVAPDDAAAYLSDPNEGCDYFDLAYGEPPYIAMPDNGAQIDVLDPAILNVAWAHNAFGAPSLYEYTLKIIDITNFQDIDPVDIIEQPGVPVLYEDVYEGLLYAGLNDLDFEEGHRYAMRVTVVDPEDHVRFEQAGKSNVVVFSYGAIEEEVPLNAACACANESGLPTLALNRPDPESKPRTVRIKNITAYKSALLACKTDADSTTHQVSYVIDWAGVGNIAADFSVQPPVSHSYADLDQIPGEICVTFFISRKDGSGDVCQKEVCLNVVNGFFDGPVVEDVTNIAVGSLGVGDTIRAGEHGEFEVVLSNVTGSKSAYSGNGTVFIGWLQARLKVVFKNITVDNKKRLRSGRVIGKLSDNPPTYPKDWPLEALASNSWTNKVAGSLVKWVETNTNAKVPYKSPNAFTNPLTMPLGLVFSGSDELVIAEMAFLRNKAQLSIIGAMETPLSWGEPKLVGFRATKIGFHPASIIPSPKRLELVADLLVEDANLGTSYTFVAPSDVRTGCYLEWGETGFAHFGLELETLLSRNWVVPVNDNGVDFVKVSLAAQAASWDDVVFVGNLEKCEVVGTEGITMEAQSISYDMSDVTNALQLKFPKNYQGEKSNLFRGFYAKSLKLHLPKVWADANKPLDIEVSDMIIDNMGITMKVAADNVAIFNTTSVVDMAASVDRVEIEMVSSSLTHATVTGKIGLPISDIKKIKDNSKVNYSATLHVVPKTQQTDSLKSYVQLVISPTNKQEIDFDFIHSKLLLESTSNIVAYADEDKVKFDMNLSGDVNIKDIAVGPLSLNSLGMHMEQMTLSYNSEKAKIEFDKGKSLVWSKNSPQKYLADSNGTSSFPITFQDITYEESPAKSNEYFHGKLNFKVAINLTKNLAGYGLLSVENAILKNNSFAKFEPIYIEAKLKEIKVNSDLGAVKILGLVKIRDKDTVFGNGFLGQLKATFKVPKTIVNATAEFGKVNDYRYWRIQAGATFSPPILLGGGIGFFGMGGGAYYNMTGKYNSAKNIPLIDKYKFTPKKGKAGMMLSASLGAPKVETFNSDMQIMGQMNLNTNGMERVAFDADFWMGSNLENRPKAPIKGSATISYDFVEEIFNMNAAIDINKTPIKANQIGLNLYFDKTDKWYLKCGEPANPNTVSVGLEGFHLDTDSYFMFGSSIPVPAAFSSRFSDGYENALGHKPGFTPTIEASSPSSNAGHGAGIALGTGFNFKAEGYVYLGAGYHAGIAGTAGTEFNLSLLEYPVLLQAGKGWNGWQAGGSIGFYASVNAGVYSKKNKKYLEEFTLASFGGGGYVIGRFPNPVWLEGEVAGRVKVGCIGDFCLFNESAAIGFEYGEKINPGDPATKVQEAKTDEETIEVLDQVVANINTDILRYVHPESYANFPVDIPISMKFITTPNEAFEIQGISTTRIFKLKADISLWEKGVVNCEWNSVPYKLSENGIGETILKATRDAATESIKKLKENTNPTLENKNTAWKDELSNVEASHHLLYNTDYKISVDVVLQEWKNGKWTVVIFDGKPYGVSRSILFTTVEGPRSISLLLCDENYHKMTVIEYARLTKEQRDTLNEENGGTYFISDDGLCECPRLSAEEKYDFLLAGDARDARKLSTGVFFDGGYGGPPGSLLGGGPPDSGGYGGSGPGGPGGGVLGGGFLNTTFSETNVNFNTVNSATEGSFGSMMGSGPAGNGNF